MPFIVTTRFPESSHVLDCAVVSRRAVATLEEAQASIRANLHDARVPQGDVRGPRLWSAVASLSRSGGSVGPLPDGTVIEVEPISWTALYAASKLKGRGWHKPEILTGYNARGGS